MVIGNGLHHRVKVFEEGGGEVGNVGSMVEVNRFAREPLTGQEGVIRAGTETTEPAETTPSWTGTACAHRTQIQDMDGPIRHFRCKRVEGHQASRQKN